jgi:hypothetical protein
MNNISGAFLYHAGETFGFELSIRALNDYHLKEVQMRNLPGFYYHCEILEALLSEK